jgi:hypothetical protein
MRQLPVIGCQLSAYVGMRRWTAGTLGESIDATGFFVVMADGGQVVLSSRKAKIGCPVQP